jgi:nucleotide sugar dehydrogenase
MTAAPPAEGYRVCVVGLGKIGLPLSVQFALKGARVCGYDIDEALVAAIGDRRNPMPSEPGLEQAVPSLVASGRLRARTDPEAATHDANVVIFIVPVDIDATLAPDFALFDAAVAAVAPHVRPGALVIVETTVPVGTTRLRVGSQIEAASGLAPGSGFSLAFSPERVSSGRVLRDLATYPKVVGGIDAHSTELAAAFYRSVLDADVMTLRDAETAEFSKLAETTYRDVNIALANEFARIADRAGVDVLQAIEAANSQPYSHIHQPGVGVGGHCIPVYPYFLASPETEIAGAARRLNDDMARYATDRLAEALGDLRGATVVVLGLAYRAGVKESRHSSAFRLVTALAAREARVYVHDPLFSDDEIRALGLEPPPSLPLPAAAVAVQAWHEQYAALDLRAFDGLRAVLDGRGVLDPQRIAALGVRYVGIGR